jgi:5-methylcytosine-specific restriction endonuclease McrA
MDLLHSPDQYLYYLHTTSSSEAKRIWRKQILEKWDHKCAYCESNKNLTIDHIIPQSKVILIGKIGTLRKNFFL